METINNTKTGGTEVLQPTKMKNAISGKNEITGVYSELEQGVHAALETYSNVHRGSGHYSMVTTHLFEQAREIILEYLGLQKGRYVVIFCTPRRAEDLIKQLKPENYKIVSSSDIGLSIGVRALAIKRKALPRGIPFQTGRGTAKLISKERMIRANAPRATTTPETPCGEKWWKLVLTMAAPAA